MAEEAFYQIPLSRCEGDQSDFIFSIPTLDAAKTYRLLIVRDLPGNDVFASIIGVPDIPNSEVRFTPNAADVTEANIGKTFLRTYFYVYEEDGATGSRPCIQSGTIDWQQSPN